MHIYEGKSGKLITTILRPGKRPSGQETVSVLKRLVKRLREVWPEVGILIRGDGHYSSPFVYDFCEQHKIDYVLGMTAYSSLHDKAQSLISQAKKLYLTHQRPTKLYGEFFHQSKSWSSPTVSLSRLNITSSAPILVLLLPA